jgi:HK97 family phage major capsid protein
MKAGELTGYSIFGNELLQDNATGLAAMISELFGEATGYYLDYAVLVGDGIDKPMGVVNAGATIKFTRAGGAGTSTLAFTDLTAMKRRILPKYRKGAFWAVTLSAEDALWNIVDSGGRPLFLPNFPGTTGGPITADTGSGVQNILGLPYEVTEKLPAYGTTGDIALIAPQGYMIGERMGLEIAASPHVYFLNNETVYRFVARVAGQPLLDLPYTAIDGTTQASHFCVLN